MIDISLLFDHKHSYLVLGISFAGSAIFCHFEYLGLKMFTNFGYISVLLLLSGFSHAAPAPLLFERQNNNGVIDCKQFTYDPSTAESLRCIQVKDNGFPKEIGGAQVALYRFYDGWTDDPRDLETLNVISDVADQVLPAYQFFAEPMDVTFVLSPKISDDAAADTIPDSGDGKRCYVRILMPQDDYEDYYMKLVIAHELCHCVQYRNKPDSLNRYGIGLYESLPFPSNTADSIDGRK
jgi:hypothetical protein